MSAFLGQVWGPLGQVLGLAQGAAGGALPAVLAQLENAGLGERVRSWVGQGENLPVTEAELERVFTRRREHIADDLGMATVMVLS